MESYDLLNSAYVELKTDLNSQTNFIGKNLSQRMNELRKTLVEHKHAMGSGEAMPPWEASSRKGEELEKYKVFYDHVQAHFAKEHSEWKVKCKICGKTFEEITSMESSQ